MVCGPDFYPALFYCVNYITYCSNDVTNEVRNYNSFAMVFHRTIGFKKSRVSIRPFSIIN
jgi:hypothetical protein